jgi:hypothetical protein
MRKIKLILQYIKSLLLIKIISLISFGIYNYKNNSQQKFSPYSQNITKIKVRDGKLSKIGIISDLQLKKNISTKFFNYYAYNVYRALKIF